MLRQFVKLLALQCLMFGFFFALPQVSRAENTVSKQLHSAIQALDAGWPQQAVELLSGPCTEARLAPYWDRTRARALVKAGQIGPAVKIYDELLRKSESLKADHPFRVELETSWATLAKSSARLKAAKLLGKISHPPEHWATAAELLRKENKNEKADHLERRILIEAPASAIGRSLGKRLGSSGISARLKTTKEKMKRLRNLLAAHENQTVIKEAKALKSGPACEKLYIIGKAQRKTRKYKQAIKTLRKARSVCAKKSSLWMRASLLSAQVHTIKREHKSVGRIVEMMEKNQSKHSFVDDGLIQLAKVYDRKGQSAKARKIFKRIVKDHATGDQLNFAAWRIAYSHIRNRDFEKAKPWLLKLRGRHAPQGAYWMARGRESKNRKLAVQNYQKLILEPPLSFYSWLALGRLDKIAPQAAAESRKILREKQKIVQDMALSAEPTARPKALQSALLLHQSGLTFDAIAEIVWWSQQKRTRKELVQAVAVLHELGAFSEAQHILRWNLRDLLKDFPNKSTGADWLRAYSLAFKGAIQAAANKQKIDPLFLFALSREESTFDPQIVSWAGAVGLCQLMPTTGIAAYADLYRKRLTDLDRLLEPKLNAQLGAHVLKEGLKRFKNVKALALAAYNAGPRFAQNSLPIQKAQEFDFWVESLGIRETRRYVKRVLETYGRYRFLHGKSGDFMRFPEEIQARKGPTPKSGSRY